MIVKINIAIGFRPIVILFIFCSLFLPVLGGCSDNKDDDLQLSVRNNWKEYLERVRNGTGFISHTKGLYAKGILSDLFEYLKRHKDKIYKGDEEQCLYDQAMIKLMASDFIDSFKLYREYIEKTGDDIRPWLHVGLRIGRNEHLLEAFFLVGAIDNAEVNKRHRLTNDEVLFLIKWVSSHFFSVIPEDKIDKEVKKTEEYQKKLSYGKNFEEAFKQYSSEELIDELYYLDFPELYIDKLSAGTLSDKELRLIYRYHLGKKQYQKAYKLATEYGYGKTVKIGVYDMPLFLKSILEVLYNLGKYDELISVYENYKDNEWLISLERTYCSGYFWIASTYAQKGEYDKALEFLRQAFENTYLFNKSQFGEPQPPDGTWMNTFSLLWHIILSDAFEKFKEVGRYSEIDQLMEQGLAKYRHLDWFQ